MLIAGRYRLDASIGRGAMGEVWQAYDETLGRAVAVKLLLAQEADPTAAHRFRLEAQTAGRLNHPHVVGVLDFGEYGDRLFLVMELVAGHSLARVLADAGTLPAERVARMAAQAAAGLAAAHQQGIVHRDIKPANLLLDSDGTLKIGDFGIARFLDDPAAALTATGQIVGTSLYLAPERALGRPAGPASDVYSLGCVLYQLLTGLPPFQADTALAILHQHLDAVPVAPREMGVPLPPAFENYLLGLLAKEPEDRPTAEQTADWFATGAWQGRAEPLPPASPAAWQQPAAPAGGTGPATTYMLPSASTSVSPAAPGRSHRGDGRRAGARRPVSRRPALVGGVAGVLLFVGAVLVGMAWFGQNSGTPETSRDSPGRTTGSEPGSAPSAGPDSAPAPVDAAVTHSPSVLPAEQSRQTQPQTETETQTAAETVAEAAKATEQAESPEEGKRGGKERGDEEDEDD
ncbi:serine/threonine-protein kinase [Streptomyces sp. NPDC014986]|uniref:serine/threonine-protein kinase n=1 Tax=Streptomyces sp. NPDC014986 TaxID=3364934 RepID=UPI0036FB9795